MQQDLSNQNIGINLKKKSKIEIILFVIIASIVILDVVIMTSKNRTKSTTNNPDSGENIYSNYTEDYSIENRNIIGILILRNMIAQSLMVLFLFLKIVK